MRNRRIARPDAEARVPLPRKRSGFALRMAIVLIIVLFGFTVAGAARSQEKTPEAPPAAARVETNIIFGMYSGLALVMDVHYPANPNGYGIIFIPGSGWLAPMGYDARP